MKALSIQQPHAHCILHVDPPKDWENRTWKTNYRGPILIHVGKKIDIVAWHILTEESGFDLPPIDELQTGGIVGMVDIVDCISVAEHPEIHSMWLFGPYALKLANPQPLNFLPLLGKLGLFNVDDAVIKDAA